jgi:DNA invertase Pin-like site-specific DNA recombinase
MERSGRWLRVSSNRQDEQDQVPDCQRWESAHDYDVKRIYTVHGGSAFKGNKKFDDEWAKVIRDIINGVITVLVVWKTDRIDRKLNTYQMIKEVVEAGGRVEFVTQPHLNDLSHMGGRVALKVQEEVAYEESVVKSDRTLNTHAILRSNGFITGRPMFGYTIVGAKKSKRYEVDENLRPIVVEIFNRCIAGDSLVTIARWLDSKGIATPRGGLWSAASLRNVIRSRAYMGYITNGDGKVVGTCPLIIDADSHKLANTKLSSRPKRGPALPENKKLCSDRLSCARCGSPMYHQKTGSMNYSYYRCNGSGPARKGCGNMIRIEGVDAAVDESMSADHRPIQKRTYIPGHNHDAEIADVDFRITQLSPEGLTRAEYMVKLQALWDEKESYEHMEDVPDNWTTEEVKDADGNVVTYASAWRSADFQSKRAMLKEWKITAEWMEIDGLRYPIVVMVPLWVSEEKPSSVQA